MTDRAMNLEELNEALCKMANEQLVSPEYERLYAVPLNVEAGRIYILQRAHFVLNRRSCWAHVQGAAPFDVKGLIWQHEQEELVGDPSRGLENHYTLGIQEGESLRKLAKRVQERFKVERSRARQDSAHRKGASRAADVSS